VRNLTLLSLCGLPLCLQAESGSAELAAGPPDLLWPAADRVGEIAAMGLLMPVGALIDANGYFTQPSRSIEEPSG